MNYKERIIDYLVDNRHYLKHIISPHKETKKRLLSTEAKEFSDNIIFDYLDLIKFITVNECSKATAIDYETITVVLNDVDLEEFLNA